MSLHLPRRLLIETRHDSLWQGNMYIELACQHRVQQKRHEGAECRSPRWQHSVSRSAVTVPALAAEPQPRAPTAGSRGRPALAADPQPRAPIAGSRGQPAPAAGRLLWHVYILQKKTVDPVTADRKAKRSSLWRLVGTAKATSWLKSSP